MDTKNIGVSDAQSNTPKKGASTPHAGTSAHLKEPPLKANQDSSYDRGFEEFSVDSVSNVERDRSPYLVNRLFETENENLFNHVKFNLVKGAIDDLGIENPKILDVGCGLKVAKMYLQKLGVECRYFGIDYEPRFSPDAVVDLNKETSLQGVLPWKPDVVLILDVLEHLHDTPAKIENVLSNLRKGIGDDAEIIVTLPQLYRMDRFKLAHLHYPEHKIRLRQDEWRSILESEFSVSRVQGLGYISVIPYLPMLSKSYKPDNKLGSLFNYLRGTVFEWPLFKPADLWLSNTAGNMEIFKTMSNDILFTARVKNKLLD